MTATTALGVVTFKGQKIEVTIGEGNFSYKETYNREYLLNRGLLNTVKAADDTPLELSFDIEWDYISSACPLANATIPTIEEALRGDGAAADWVNSSTDTCEDHAVNIEFWNVPSCTGANFNEKFIFADFRVEGLDHNPDDSQISCTGKCNILKPVIRRY